MHLPGHFEPESRHHQQRKTEKVETCMRFLLICQSLELCSFLDLQLQLMEFRLR